MRIFRSPVAALRELVDGSVPLPFPLLADPERRVYRLFGVGASWLALLSSAARARAREARASGLRPRWRDALRDGIGGSPADFLVGPDGRLLRARYGGHFADSIGPRAALEWIDSARGAAADSSRA